MQQCTFGPKTEITIHLQWHHILFGFTLGRPGQFVNVNKMLRKKMWWTIDGWWSPDRSTQEASPASSCKVSSTPNFSFQFHYICDCPFPSFVLFLTCHNKDWLMFLDQNKDASSFCHHQTRYYNYKSLVSKVDTSYGVHTRNYLHICLWAHAIEKDKYS